MKRKITYILTTAVIILTAFYIGRNTAEPTTKVIHAMPEIFLACTSLKTCIGFSN